MLASKSATGKEAEKRLMRVWLSLNRNEAGYQVQTCQPGSICDLPDQVSVCSPDANTSFPDKS